MRLALPSRPSVPRARTAPTPTPRPDPIFIHDAITPYRGETLLSAMLRADLEQAMKDDLS